FAGSCFPYGFSANELAVLLQQRDTQSGLSRNDSGRRLLSAGYQAEERRLATTVPSENSPTLTTSDGKRHSGKNGGGSKLDADVRNRDLCQERKAVEQAVRQRSIVSTV